MTQDFPLNVQERVMFHLRSLYSSFGYTQYQMTKFEEYDLYARNKDFLISDRAITFTDTNGKLMALKPDVTLSIVKNTRTEGDALQKLYYNENVYRISKNSRSFREIMQTGLEILGKIDDYCLCEAVNLAAQSLEIISPEWILNLSHLGILSDLMDHTGIPAGKREQALKCIAGKNAHELAALCREWKVSRDRMELLLEALATSGPLKTVLPRLSALLQGIVRSSALETLEQIARAMEASGQIHRLRFDFSVVDDMHYYNGIVFKGFIHPLPGSVLSGGQYDRLMQKMGRKNGAVGFAVYLDALERLEEERPEYDVDNLLLYTPETPAENVFRQVRQLQKAGQSVLALTAIPQGIRFRRLLKLDRQEVLILENA